MSSKINPGKAYLFPIILFISIALGAAFGAKFGEGAMVLQPVADLFVNALFMLVVPLVFTTICSTIATMSSMERLGRVMKWMLFFFFVTGAIASSVAFVVYSYFPPATNFSIAQTTATSAASALQNSSIAGQFVNAFTVDDFSLLLSRKSMLQLIVFTIFFGLSLQSLGERGRAVGRGIAVIAEAMIHMVQLVMYLAPFGLFAYFAILIGHHGPQLLGVYFKAIAVYYATAIVYFFIAFTIYVAWATRGKGVKIFWSRIVPPALMSLGSGSSTATLPLNMQAATSLGVPQDVSGLVLPIGATAHMEGSCISGILKIAFLYGMYNMPFTGVKTLLLAIFISVLSGVVHSGVTGGGLIGEALIISLYGFPPEAFPIIVTLAFLVDPMATMLNSVGDTVSSMMITRVLEGKNWFSNFLKGGQDN